MSFKTLTNEDLVRVADYFVVDVEAANPEKPSKKELLAALASGDEPVTWEQYETIYLPNQPEFKAAQDAEKKAVEEAEAEAAKNSPVKPEDVDTSDWVVVKYKRQNPRYDVAGLTFTKAHPYRTVHPDTAAYLVRQCEGFELALPDEVADYYN